jgi:hypothetical protein
MRKQFEQLAKDEMPMVTTRMELLLSLCRALSAQI